MLANYKSFYINKKSWNKSYAHLPAISVRQPYAWLIVNGIKDVENRSTRINYRGEILIHASLNKSGTKPDNIAKLENIASIKIPEDLDYGGIIGVATIINCVKNYDSEWAINDHWGWVLSDAKPLTFKPCRGALGFFKPKLL